MEHLIGKEKLVLSGAGISERFRSEMLDLCGVEKPNVLIDASAKSDQEKYYKARERMGRFFNDAGIKNVSWLQNSITHTITESERTELIDEADIFLVLGGSTRAAHNKWQTLNISEQIQKRVRDGEMIAAGTSAGSMIWFDKGYSDSNKAEVKEGEYWDYEVVEATGFIDAWVTAHHSDIDEFGRDRAEGFKKSLEENSSEWEVAVGIDVFAALVCHDGLARAVDLRKSKSTQKTHEIYIYSNGSTISREVLAEGDTVGL